MKTFIFCFFAAILFGCSTNKQMNLPRVIVSTDIGESDPDDFQSMVHLLVYADTLNIEGLVSSPPFEGSTEQIKEVIGAYATDYPNLVRHSNNFPKPEYLLEITKQ